MIALQKIVVGIIIFIGQQVSQLGMHMVERCGSLAWFLCGLNWFYIVSSFKYDQISFT